MSLCITKLPPQRGVAWVRTSFVLFFRSPLRFSLLFFLFLVATLFLTVLPVVGAVLFLATMPLLTLGFAAATRAAQRGEAVHAGLLFEPFQPGADASRRRVLLRLCLLYATFAALALLLAQAIDGGAFERLQVLLGAKRADETQREIDALMADSGLVAGLFVRVVLLGLLSVPFWHAPMLVRWHGQGLAQSLFSSALACWRNKGALTVYMLTWAAASAAVGVVAAVLVALLGAQQFIALVLLPAALLLSVTFYVSLYLVHADSFGIAGDAAAA